MRNVTAGVIARVAFGWCAYFPQAKTAPLLACNAGTSILNITPLPDGLKPGDEAVKASFLCFPSQKFFAAFAIGPEGRYGWFGGRHDCQTARNDALGRCGPGCVIFLENLPNHYESDLTGRTVAQKFVGKLDMAPEATAKARYFALASNGAWPMQGVRDEGRFTAWTVLQRYNNFAYSNWLIATLANGCSLFYSPIVIADDKRSTG